MVSIEIRVPSSDDVKPPIYIYKQIQNLTQSTIEAWSAYLRL